MAWVNTRPISGDKTGCFTGKTGACVGFWGLEGAHGDRF